MESCLLDLNEPKHNQFSWTHFLFQPFIESRQIVFDKNLYIYLKRMTVFKKMLLSMILVIASSNEIRYHVAFIFFKI